MGVRTNVAPHLDSIGGVVGWHRSGARINVRLVAGQFITFVAAKHPAILRQEAEWLRLKADVLDAYASDKEEGNV